MQTLQSLQRQKRQEIYKAQIDPSSPIPAKAWVVTVPACLVAQHQDHARCHVDEQRFHSSVGPDVSVHRLPSSRSSSLTHTQLRRAPSLCPASGQPRCMDSRTQHASTLSALAVSARRTSSSQTTSWSLDGDPTTASERRCVVRF